jgi:hypothetical protein
MSDSVERRRRSRAEADRLVLEFEQTGLTGKQFCDRHGVSRAILDNYRKRKSALADRRDVSFVPVELIGSEPNKAFSLCLELRNGRRIEVGRDFDAGVLERLIAVADRI